MTDTIFGPPEVPIMVRCILCREAYMSSEMVPKVRFKGTQPLWHCANPHCDARGFERDIWPARDDDHLSEYEKRLEFRRWLNKSSSSRESKKHKGPR